MKKWLLVFILVVVAIARAEPTTATLSWRNGESIPGKLTAATAETATWMTPLFEEPLVLRWNALRRIDQPREASRTADPFAFRLRDGSYLFGDLVSIDENVIAIRSTLHGDAKLKRSEVLSLQRLRGGDLVFAGPTGNVGWSPMPNQKAANNANLSPLVSKIASGPGGALLLPFWNGGAALETALPERVAVEFRVRSSLRPEFQIALSGDGHQWLRIETWDDELVLAAGAQFKSLRKIADADREIGLRVFWDRPAKKCSVFTEAGEWLADWEFAVESGGTMIGIGLQNNGRDLALEMLRVQPWNGARPTKIDLTKPRVALADGRAFEAKVIRASASGVVLDPPVAEAQPTLADLQSIVFSTDALAPREREATISFDDGTEIFGEMPTLANGSGQLRVAFSDAPLHFDIGGLRRWLVHPAAPEDTPLTALDTMVAQQTTLHGTVSGAGDASPRWLAVGAVKPALAAKGTVSEITRAFPPDAKPQSAPALFYTVSGDVLPGTLRALDRTGVEFESGIVEATKLPSENLDAIQFGASGQGNINGFGDAGWRVLKGTETTLRKSDEKVGLDPGTSLGHPSVLQSSEVKFSLESSGYSGVRLRLFCAGTDPAKTTNLIISCMGNRVYAGIESSEGQLANQRQVAIPVGGPVVVRLGILEKQIDVYVNDVPLQKYNIPPAKRLGVGLIIEPASLWGNMVSPATLSSFTAQSVPGRTWLPEVAPETKTQALTVPRFRKDDPPRHVMIGTNGDVIRGEIEAVTTTHFGFRSGLENLRIPRDRVKAAVWLKKPGAETVQQPASPVSKRLEKPIERQTRYSGSGLQSLIAFLQREAADLKFKLPDKTDSRRFQMDFGNQTIGEALDQICAIFELHYRIDPSGTIVLEAGPRATGGVVQKVYWLEQRAFPTDAPAQEVLAKRGIAFPAGASATWQEKIGQLAMTNTAANHVALAKLIVSDFGGSTGSPTHWLQLASGARLGLAVDQFAPDFVAGHHPLYGRCKIPMTEIVAIRTGMPEPTAAMLSLESWRLVFAPEPVVPESGGESSPMLGKVATPFKLPMLGGGDFDLSAEKGKVVVLDFWATWCGPCIKSLPGLIEVMSAFPTDRVKLIGVNQSEAPEQVKRFLETRGWKLEVAMDAGQSIAQKYGVDGIPHTVIVGPDGNIAWVKTGYSPDGDAEAAKAVQELLAPTK